MGSSRYSLSRLPEVPWVGEAAVELWQLFKHFHEDSEAGPLAEVEGPAGREDFLQRTVVPHDLSSWVSCTD